MTVVASFGGVMTLLRINAGLDGVRVQRQERSISSFPIDSVSESKT